MGLTEGSEYGIPVFLCIWSYSAIGSQLVCTGLRRGRFVKNVTSRIDLIFDSLLDVDSRDRPVDKAATEVNDAALRQSLKSAVRQYFMLPFLLPLLYLPFLVPPTNQNMSFWRSFNGFSSLFFFIRACEVFFQKRFRKETRWRRFLHIGVAFHDIHKCERIPEEELKDTFTQYMYCVAYTVGMFANCLLGFVAYSFLLESPKYQWPLKPFVKGTSAYLTGYAFLKFLDYELKFHMLTLGYSVPNLMDDVYYSKSVAEYWLRWDTVMQNIFYSYAYKPARKLGFDKGTAAMSTFVVSGLFHVWPAWIAAYPKEEYFKTVGTFILNACFIRAERELRVSKWSPVMARTWVASCVVATALWSTMRPAEGDSSINPSAFVLGMGVMT